MQDNHVAGALREALGGEWELLFKGDNWVMRSETMVAKIPQHPDGKERLACGIRGAKQAHAAGVPVVKPLLNHLIDTAAGPASLWPWVNNRGVTAENITPTDARDAGAALAKLNEVPAEDTGSWNPFARIPSRLASSSFPEKTINTVRDLVEAAQDNIPAPGNYFFAHGDASISNVLVAEGVLLIDFDSSGARPQGWDLTCMYTHLVFETGKENIFEALQDGWCSHQQVPEKLEQWSFVKAVMGTSFILTLDASEANIDAVHLRASALNSWLKTGKPTPLQDTGLAAKH